MKASETVRLFRRLPRRTSFGLILVPCALSLISLLTDSPHNWWAIGLTLATIALAMVWEVWREMAERRRLQGATGGEVEVKRQYGAVVTPVSAYVEGRRRLPGPRRRLDGESDDTCLGRWTTSLYGRLVTQLQPDHLVLLVSDAAGEMERDIRDWAGADVNVEAVRFPAASDIDMAALRDTGVEAIQRAIELAGDKPVLVDVTAGTAVFSVALYEAALRCEGVVVTYQHTPPDTDGEKAKTVIRQIAHPHPTEEVM